MKKIILLMVATLVLAACQAPVFISNTRSNTVSLTLGFTPAQAHGFSVARSTGSRLLLANASYLVATLTDSTGKSFVQTATSTGGATTLAFSGIALGQFQVDAKAYADATMASLLFTNTSQGTAADSGNNLSMYLLPANLISATGNDSGTLNPGSVSYTYHLGNAAHAVTITLSAQGLSYYLQDSKGAPISDDAGFIAPAATDGTVIATLYNAGGAAAYTLQMVESSPLAFYSLNNTVADATGNNFPITLTNAPFLAGGGVSSNGLYINAYPNTGAAIQTPNITGFNYSNFNAAVEFEISGIPGARNAIIIGGNSWRWIGAYIETNGTISLKYNNSYTATSTTAVPVGQFNKLVLKYDGTNGYLYLNGVLAVTQPYILDNGYLGSDPNFGNTDYSNGNTFIGTLRNLQVW